MKKNALKKIIMLIALSAVLAVMLTGCGQSNAGTNENPLSVNTKPSSDITSANEGSTEDENTNASSEDYVSATQLYVTFGDNGSPFIMHLYDNDTAAAIARHVGSAEWRLPIYNYDGYDNWEVMQYYDIPSQYEIPSNPETVTSESSGAVYYSEPNRIVLFYGDAEVSGEYTQVGYFESTDEFVNAISDNPILEGWENKIIQISANESFGQAQK